MRRLVETVVPGGEAGYLTVQPEADAVVNECFPNVEAKIARAGGRMLCGWQLWEWPHVLVEAEFHAVWRPGAPSFRDQRLVPVGARGSVCS
ncbi:hypothetical protein [Luteimonas salinilitoris]|uniref:Uncharacterized protein n=1 Tax=Luteimonas salinilitoris TaxID=3237697 RepID=A0ABV4HVA1_9GAMM